MENFNTVPDKGTFGGSVEVINQNFLLAQQEMEILRNLISPDTKFVTAVATAQTTSVTQVLPVTGSTDTVYRVGNWDGSQYDPSVYSEYAWNGSAYIKLNTKSQAGEVYDISANHSGAKYADLAAALGTNGANIPQSLRKGGMSVKFVQSSDNKYVQYRYMGTAVTGNPNPFLDTANWQGVDDEPTAGSDNLVKSGGVYGMVYTVKENLFNRYASDISEGKWIDYNSGNLNDANQMVTSGYIPIEAGKTYVVKSSAGYYGTSNGKNVATYDINKDNYQRLSGVLLDNNNYIQFTPYRNGYVRFTLYAKDIANAMMLEGTVYPSEYISYGVSCNIPQVKELEDNILPLNNMLIGKNLFNKNADGILIGKFIDYSHSGVISDQENMMTSDYIPVVLGNTYVVKAAYPFYGSFTNNIASYDKNKENLIILKGVLVDNNYIQFVAQRNGYVRFSIYSQDVDSAMMIEASTYPSEYEPFGSKVNYVEKESLKDDVYNDNPYEKHILWLGDSIGYDGGEEGGYGWSGRVARRYRGTFYSLARNGNTITKNVAAGVGSVLTKLEELYTTGKTGDYLIIEGGTNDADRIGSILDGNIPEKFGSWNKNDFSGNYDEETFCGAVDSLFYKALTYYKGVKLGFIIAQKMGTKITTFNNRRAYFYIIKDICEKWGVPCIDLWSETWLNPNLINHYDPSKTVQENIDAGNYYVDGQHLTEYAYDYLAVVIGKWIETL